MDVYEDENGDAYSILIVNSRGRLMRLKAPFRVRCIVSIHNFKEGTTLYVDAVLGSTNGDIIYLIFRKPIGHTAFTIEMK